MHSNYNRIIQLVRYISKEGNIGTRDKSEEEKNIEFQLMQEYFGRILRLKRYTGFSTFLSPIGFNAVNGIGVDFDDDIDKIVKNVCPELENLDNSIHKYNCISCLNWLILADKGNEIACKFYDLYESLLLFFAIGGYLTMDHGDLQIGTNVISHGDAVMLIGSDTPIDIYDITLESGIIS